MTRKSIELLNQSIVPLESLPAPLPLHQTKLAKAIGNEHAARLQAVLDTTPNKRWAYFWNKYVRVASVATLTFRQGTSCSAKFRKVDGIYINLIKDSGRKNPFLDTVHEVAHAIDYALTNGEAEIALKSAYDKGLQVSYSELKVGENKYTLADAIVKDKEFLKAKYNAKIAELKELLKGIYSSGYDLPVMVLGGKYGDYRCEYFSTLAMVAIAEPAKYDELKTVIPNTVEFFELLIEYFTPEFNPAVIHVIKAKYKYNAKGKLLISFNGQYSIKEMMERLQTLGGLSFNAAYSVLLRAVKYGKALQSEQIVDEVENYEQAALRIKNLAKLMIGCRQTTKVAA